MRPGPATTLALTTLALPAVIAVLSGCGTTTIDVAKSERFIRGVVANQIGARVASVSCPDEVEAKEGTSFTCRVTGTDRSRGTVTVHQRDDDVQVVAPFLHVREAEAAMTAGIEKQIDADDVRVACPEIIVVRAGSLFSCTASSAGKEREVKARLTDADGRFRYRLS